MQNKHYKRVVKNYVNLKINIDKSKAFSYLLYLIFYIIKFITWIIRLTYPVKIKCVSLILKSQCNFLNNIRKMFCKLTPWLKYMQWTKSQFCIQGSSVRTAKVIVSIMLFFSKFYLSKMNVNFQLYTNFVLKVI